MTCPCCSSMSKRLAAAEAELEQLKRDAYGEGLDLPDLGLTPQQEVIVRCMIAANGRTLSREFIIDATRRTGSIYKEYPEPKMVDTVICKLRQKFKPWGLEIETVWGRGFRLTPEAINTLMNWPARQAA